MGLWTDEREMPRESDLPNREMDVARVGRQTLNTHVILSSSRALTAAKVRRSSLWPVACEAVCARTCLQRDL